MPTPADSGPPAAWPTPSAGYTVFVVAGQRRWPEAELNRQGASQIPMRRIVAAVSIALVVMGFGLLAWYLSGYMPGTFFRDENGNPYGTGWTYYYYESGELMLEEKFVAGKGQYSRWFRPDGSVVAETNWVDESGVGYYLREYGSIRARMLYVYGLAHGTAVYFDTDGSVIREVMFHEGHEELPETPHIEISDVSSRPHGEDRILRVEPLDDEAALPGGSELLFWPYVLVTIARLPF